MTRDPDSDEETDGSSGGDPDGASWARRIHADHWQHAFDTAQRMYLHVKPPAGEFSGDWVMYAEWPSIVTCYNGIEMVMKLLLDQQGSCSPDQWKQELGHDLAKAWGRLDPETKDHVEYHYAQHRSLHYHPDPPFESATAKAFIGHINGENKSGSVDWRYAPLMDYDDLKPPRLLAWTMFEVWNALICHLEFTAASDDGGPQGCSCLVSHMVTEEGPLAVSASDFNHGDKTLLHDKLDSEAREELFRWLHSDNWAVTILANTIRWLAVHVRGAWHEIDLREPLIEWLKARADVTMREMRESQDPDVKRLWHRLMLANGRLQFGKVQDPADPGPPRFEFSVQPPYESKFAVCDDGDTRCHVRASDLLVGDAVGLPTLSRLSLEPRNTPTGATLSVPGCALEEFRLDAPSGHRAAFGSETVWQVDTVTAHLCEDRVIGERTIGFSDSPGAKLTLRLGDDQQLLWLNDEATAGSRCDYKFVMDLPDPQSDPDTVLEDLQQAGYTATPACPDPRLMLEFLEVARSHDRYPRNRGSQWVCVPFRDARTLTDIAHTRIREIQRIIESRLRVPEHESLRIENRCGDRVRVLADHQMRSATTIMTETRLVGIVVRNRQKTDSPPSEAVHPRVSRSRTDAPT